MLRDEILKLAHAKPQLRRHLLPLVMASTSYSLNSIGSMQRVTIPPLGEIFVEILGYERHFTDWGPEMFVDFYQVKLPSGEKRLLHPMLFHFGNWKKRSTYESAFDMFTKALRKSPVFKSLKRVKGSMRGILGYESDPKDQDPATEEAIVAALMKLPHAHATPKGVEFQVPTGDNESKTHTIKLSSGIFGKWRAELQFSF